MDRTGSPIIGFVAENLDYYVSGGDRPDTERVAEVSGGIEIVGVVGGFIQDLDSGSPVIEGECFEELFLLRQQILAALEHLQAVWRELSAP